MSLSSSCPSTRTNQSGSAPSLAASASPTRVDGRFGNINIDLKSDKNIFMDAFRKTFALANDAFSDIKNPNFSEIIMKYEKLSDTFTLRKNNSKCIVCRNRETSISLSSNKTFDYSNYLRDILCDICMEKLQTAQEYFSEADQPPKRPPKLTDQYLAAPCSLPHTKPTGFGSVAEFDDEELKLYWVEIRNSIYQIFFEEGMLLNSVAMKYINPPIFSSFVMPSAAMLKNHVKKLFRANSHKLFLLCVCHVQLFVMEIKLRLLKELLENKPYLIFPFFYTIFERLLRALQRVNLFLECVEDEFLKKNKLHWFNIHLLFFQTFVYMNRFIQKSISLICDCSTEHGFKTHNDEESRMMGRFVFRSYMTLERSVASFYLYTNTNSNNFANFFSKFDDFQMLFQFAILLFNCKNYDENIFSRRYFADDFTVRILQEMPLLNKDLLINDALNTNMFQLFLVIHHWDNTEVFDNVMKRLPQLDATKSSRSIIKTILKESFIEVGYDESTLLSDFFVFLQQDKPDHYSFDEYLAQEIVLSDEENFEDELSYCSEDSHHSPYCYHRHHHHDCECYPDMLGCQGDHYLPPLSRSYLEMRDKLRKRLTKKKVNQSQSQSGSAGGHLNVIDDKQTDERNLDDLLSFINGNSENDCDNNNTNKKKKKPRKKRNLHENHLQSKESNQVETETVIRVEPTTQQKPSKKKKNKKTKSKEKITLNGHDNQKLKTNSLDKAVNEEESVSIPDEAAEDADEEEEDDGIEVGNDRFLDENENEEVELKASSNVTMNEAALTEQLHQKQQIDHIMQRLSDDCGESPTNNQRDLNDYNDVELIEYSDEDIEEPVHYVANDRANPALENDPQKILLIDRKLNKFLDDVFKPKDIDLDNEDLDEFERELELFKRFCYDSIAMSNSCKPKVIIRNVKEIFKRI